MVYSNINNDLYMTKNFAIAWSADDGITIPKNSYSYIYFSDNTNSSHITINNTSGVIQLKDAGVYFIIVRILIYILNSGEYIDFLWNHDLDTVYRIEGSGGDYTAMAIPYHIYLDSPLNTLAVLFNRNSRDLKYAMCSIFIWKLPY